LTADLELRDQPR